MSGTRIARLANVRREGRGYRILDFGYGIWDMGYRISDMGYGIWEVEDRRLVNGLRFVRGMVARWWGYRVGFGVRL
jgi:hypothetical protein